MSSFAHFVSAIDSLTEVELHHLCQQTARVKAAVAAQCK